MSTESIVRSTRLAIAALLAVTIARACNSYRDDRCKLRRIQATVPGMEFALSDERRAPGQC